MRRVVLLCALSILGATSAASAQTGTRLPLQFVSAGDTIVGAFAGQTFTVTVQSGYDGTGWGLDSFAVRFPFDVTRIAFVSAAKLCPNTSAPLNSAVLGNVLTVSTASCNAGYFGQPLFQLTFQLLGGTVDGTWLSIVPVAARDNGATDRLGDATGDVMQVCHATGLWGDVSNDGTVNSLDALVTLSGAVGLSTGSYTLTYADVDADGQVTSRDALGMLSASIGLSTSGFRVNQGIVDRCAAQLILPRPVYFSRGSADPGTAGVSGLTIRAAGDSTVLIAGDSSDATGYNHWRPRVSPDGTQILFVCDNPYYYDAGICKADANGGNVVHLTGLTGSNESSPDWSPDGTQIVFVRNNQIWMMDSSGAAQVQAPSSPFNGVTSVSWRPVPGSHRVAYTSTAIASGELHTVVLDTASTDVLVKQMTCCSITYPRFVDWNAAGDSLLFDAFVDGYTAILSAPAAAGAGLDIRTALASGVAQQPVWTDQGVLFIANTAGYRLFLRRPDGSLLQVRPDNTDNFMPGMRRQ
jgi:hypothetical protein